jgi:hypothetical protein
MSSGASLHKKRHQRSEARAEQKRTARFRSGVKAQQGKIRCFREACLELD